MRIFSIVIVISLPPWVAVLHIVMANVQDHIPGRDITCYLGNITVQEIWAAFLEVAWVMVR